MIRKLHAALRAHRDQCAPVRVVEVPKPQGGTKPLGIATVEDRVVQTARKPYRDCKTKLQRRWRITLTRSEQRFSHSMRSSEDGRTTKYLCISSRYSALIFSRSTRVFMPENLWSSTYQHTSGPQRVFAALEPWIWWKVAHWLGRKYQISIPLVIRRYGQDNPFGTKTCRLTLLSLFKTKRYKRKTPVNPYLAERKA